MKHYLSFGGGVNSVALHLLMLREGYDFEAVYSHHRSDWPETYHYVAGFQWWLKLNGHKAIKVIRPNVQKYTSLVDYYEAKGKVPSITKRDCTDKFKVRALQKYQRAPAFVHIGYSVDESRRAKIKSDKGFEYRYLLIEHGIDRDECKDIIKRAGLPVPMKSGCYLCPFQRKAQWAELRRKHPCLFKRVAAIEARVIEDRVGRGLAPFTLLSNGKTIGAYVNENQLTLFPGDAYPPCQCGL